MKYSINKDEVPHNTVDKIKNILNSVKIKPYEKYFVGISDKNKLASLRLCLSKNSNIGTNGKGTCFENAKASAYAEFMERLQNGLLIPFNFPDKISYKKNLNFKYKDLKDYFNPKNKVFLSAKKITNLDDFFALPFFSIKKQDVCILSYNIISLIKGSNGLAAGNTIEEALVQGLSEICERYSLKQILFNKLSLPDVPKEIYTKYDNLNKIIKYLNKSGFNVYIKDASLGGKIPVILTIIENTKYNTIYLQFGSAPTLPVAIERTMTEFAQGIVPSDFDTYGLLTYYSSKKYKNSSAAQIFESIAHTKIAFEKNDELVNQFFNKKPDYQFCTEAWINNEQKLSNKQLLIHLFKQILKISDDIYIRDVSFLGFPAVNIFVPNMSEIYNCDYNVIKFISYYFNWNNYYDEPFNDAKFNIETLLAVSENLTFSASFTDSKIFDTPYEYIAFLCSLVKKNKKKIIKYIDIMLAQNSYYNVYDDEQVTMFKIIMDYFRIKRIDKMEILLRKYNKDDVDNAVDIINNLTFENILNIVLKKKTKNKSFKQLTNRLEKICKLNMPNQMDLKKFFN